MLIALGTVLTVVALPAAVIVVFLLLAGSRERARERSVIRQVAVTEAIDAELGAIVAPVVRRRLGGGWRVEVAVPVGEPAVVGRVVALAHAAMRRLEPGASPLDVVLTAQAPEVARANVGLLRRTGGSTPEVRGREAIAWTGTTTSRASW